jgi:hypothetical protein
MNAQSASDRRGILVVGILLILAGVGLIGLQGAGFKLGNLGSGESWPIFVIVPGLVLLAASVLPPAPRGVGLAVAGSIVTVVGLVLFYQQATDHWESWSYAWALVGPGGAGLGLLIYGLLFRQGDLVGAGLRLVLIAVVIFALGFWFFETIYQSGRVPAALETWWPVGLIGLGLLVLTGGLFGSGRRHGHI